MDRLQAKIPILKYPELQLNFSVKRMFELLAYNGFFGIPSYTE